MTSSQSVLISEAYERVSLVEVKRIEFAKCGSIPNVQCPDAGALLDTNSGPGAGKAAFPDAAVPGGDYQRTVLVKAELQPNLGSDSEQVTVYLRFLDVDDPSASTAPIDDDTVAATSVDNRNENATIVPAVMASSATGMAVTFFEVSTQQGNNYRVAASTYEPWLATLCGVVSDVDGLVQHTPCNAGAPPLPLPHQDGDQVSEMLTVWRTLHVEVDHLDSTVVAQTPRDAGSTTAVVLDRTGTITALARRRLTDQGATFVVATPKGSHGLVDHSRSNDWTAADLWSKDTGTDDGFVKVAGNGRTHLDVGSNIDLTVLATVGDQYRLSDDRKVDLTGELPLQLTNTLLAQAYVKTAVLDPGVNRKPVHVFDQNLDSGELASMPRDVTSSEAYWSVLVLDAFDAAVPNDNDPNDPTKPKDPVKNESGTLGETAGRIAPGRPLATQDLFQPTCGLFRETIRDSAEEHRWRDAPLERTTAHEILCHATGWEHEGLTLCHEIHLEGPDGARMSTQHQDSLRRLRRPQIR